MNVLFAISGSIILTAILIHAGVFILYRSFLKHDPQSVVQVTTELESIPQPRLQSDPQADLEQQRRSMKDHLNSYGWVDRSRGIVHMPIDRAMDLMIEREAQNR